MDKQQTAANIGFAQQLVVVKALETYNKNLPPTQWIVHPILHEGAALLSGDPKVGKSFFALQLAMAVAGKEDKVFDALSVRAHGKVLYLALDDGSEKRMQERLHQLTEDATAIENLDVVYQRNLPPLSQGLDRLLGDYLKKNNYVLVVLDTLGAVLEAANSNVSIYRMEYAETIKLQKLANEHGICLLIVHHTNKGRSKDAVARASGSHGVTGAVDAVLMLSAPQRGRGRLVAKPRDGEESQHYLERLQNGGWKVTSAALGPARQPTEDQQAVLTLLGPGPKSREEIAAKLGKSADATRKQLDRMAAAEMVNRRTDGLYQLFVESMSNSPIPTVQPVQASPPSEVSTTVPSVQASPTVQLSSQPWTTGTGRTDGHVGGDPCDSERPSSNEPPPGEAEKMKE